MSLQFTTTSAIQRDYETFHSDFDVSTTSAFTSADMYPTTSFSPEGGTTDASD